MKTQNNRPWFGLEPIENGTVAVGGRLFTIHEKQGADGFRLWPASVVLASILKDCKGSRVCEVGAGLGLPGMQASVLGADVTFIEQTRQQSDLIRQLLWENQCRGKVITADWADVDDRFDLVIGSEVIYQPHSILTLAHFISRSIRGLFCNSGDIGDQAFITALKSKSLFFSKGTAQTIAPGGDVVSVNLWNVAGG